MSLVGHAVLYAAFAVVALWLFGELLLQHRAEPHWRALALLGFLGLVAGVATGSLPLIGVGVVAFGAGQFLVTRSVRTGGSHWSLRAPDGSLPGALAGLPLLGTVFPAGEAAAEPSPQTVERVGEVGPVEPLTPSGPEYGYDPAAAYTAVEYVEQQPSYAAAPEYGYAQQQGDGYQQPQYQQQPAAVDYDYGWTQQPEPAPAHGYDQAQQQPGYYEPYQQPYQPQYDQQQYDQPYQPQYGTPSYEAPPQPYEQPYQPQYEQQQYGYDYPQEPAEPPAAPPQPHAEPWQPPQYS